MGNPINMKSTQQFLGIPVFTDINGVEQAVDAVRWTLSDSMNGVFSQDGNNVSFVADKTHPEDTAPRAALLSLEVDEGGVHNAMTDTYAVTVNGPLSSPATNVQVNFAVSDQA